MRVFLSWSKERSRSVAEALRHWLPDVLQGVDVWTSSQDIRSGKVWQQEVNAELADASFGIICVTPEAVGEAWLLFEAGALSKGLPENSVCPYLLAMDTGALAQPLGSFQCRVADEPSTFALVQDINRCKGGPQLEEERVQRQFARCWPELDEKLRAIAARSGEAPPTRATAEVLAEILQLARDVKALLLGLDSSVAPSGTRGGGGPATGGLPGSRAYEIGSPPPGGYAISSLLSPEAIRHMEEVTKGAASSLSPEAIRHMEEVAKGAASSLSPEAIRHMEEVARTRK